jgi:rod shape-determining protein MreC
MELIIRHKAIITLIFAFLFCVVSLSVQSSTFTFTIEGIGSTLVMPFQKGYHYAQKSVTMLWAGLTELNDVRQELAETRMQLQEFEAATEDLQEIKNENRRLRDLLNFRERMVYSSVPAQIISKDPDNWFHTIIINKGSWDGIKANMPVVAFSGGKKAVVGKVIEVRGTISRVLPITSPDMKVGVRLQSTRFPGLMEGLSATSNLCVIDYITKSARLTVGDMVITSGQGGIFPHGLLVGTIAEQIPAASSAFQKAKVRPVIDFNQVEEVFIIVKIPDIELIELIERH